MKNILFAFKNNLIAFIAIFCFIIATINYFYFSNEKNAILLSKQKTLKTIADFKRSQISAWFVDEVLDVELISKDPLLPELIENYLHAKNKKNKNLLISYLLQIQTEHLYEDVVLLYPDGRYLASTDRLRQLYDSVDVGFLGIAFSTGKTVKTDLYKSTYDQGVYLDFISPVSNNRNNRLAGLICRKNPNEFLNPLIKIWPSYEETSLTYLVRQDDTGRSFIYKPRQSLKFNSSCWIAVSDQDELSLKASAGYTGIINEKDDRGVRVLSYVSPIPDTSWNLVVKVDKRELLEEFHSKVIYAIIIAILFLMAFIVGIFFIHQRRQEKIYKKLLKKEVELRLYQERIKATMDILSEGVITVDLNGKIEYLNLRAEELTGFKQTDAIEKSLNDVFVINNELTGRMEFNLTGLVLGIETNKTVNHVFLVSKDGKETPVGYALTPYIAGDNPVSGFIISFHDETEDRLQEKLILKSEINYKNLFENNPHPMWVYDTETLRFLAVNNTAVLKYGYSVDEFLSMIMSDIIPEDYLDHFHEFVNTNSNFQISSTCRNKLKNGDIINVEMASHNISFYTKSARLVLANDITKTMQYEAKLIAAKEKAEENERLKTAFLANMSHEIRTPLNSIIGFSQILNDGGLKKNEIKLYSGYIAQGSSRLLDLLNNIINISKIETGVEHINLNACLINDFVKNIYSQFVILAGKNSIDFKLNLPTEEEALIIRTDTGKLGQILTNFTENAFKFTKKGSIELGYSINEDEIEFFVKDTGIGIEPENQERIFDRFYQADISISRGFEGSGLGLAICKGFADLLNGKIRLESKPWTGSTFYLTLPLNKIIKPEDMNENNRITSHSAVKILIAEDDENSMNFLKVLLNKYDYEVYEAINGKEALDICKKEPDISLILMDIKMPQMDGLEATRLIRAFNQDIIIIAQTGFAFSEDKENAMNAGCDDFITKPIKKEVLFDIINKHLA